jgi:AraC-like DNA-binding protein
MTDTSQSPIDIRLMVYRETDADYDWPMHQHSGYQWYLVTSGSVRMKLPDGEVMLGPEESVLIPPGLPRAPEAVSSPPRYMFVVFENHRLDLDPLCNELLRMPTGLRPELQALLRELIHPGTPNTNELAAALIVRLLIGLRRAYSEAEGSRAPLNTRRQQELARRVEEFMRRNLHRGLQRDDIADAVHYSAAHLADLFRNMTGTTLIARLTELRMERAKSLLIESDLPITRISLEVGYNSFSHFTQLFKRQVGVSPSDYRRMGGLTYSADGRDDTSPGRERSS